MKKTLMKRKRKRGVMSKKNEKGVALILALILVVVMSVMAVSLLFMAQTETWSGMNYRMMTQARYGAESGVNAAANYIINNEATVKPTTAQLANFAYNGVSPVKVGGVGGPAAALSADTSKGNYPLGAAQTAFHAATDSSVISGNTSVSYSPTATLLSMHTFQAPSYITSSNLVQTWKIVSDGTINGVRKADVQVSAILEQQPQPAFSYAAFAESTGCGALTFGGGGSTNSYDSSTVANAGATNVSVTTQNYGGNVGTNGNLTEKGSSTTLYGSLSTPRAGVGTCGSTVTALSLTGASQPTDGLVELPQNIIYPNPPATNPVPPTNSATVANNNPSCTDFSNCTALPASKPTDLYITAGAESVGSNPAANATLLGNVTVKGNLHFVPPAGTLPGANVYININSISSNAGGVIDIDPIPPAPGYTGPPQYANIILNVAGANTSTPIDLSGGGLTNLSLNPSAFQMVYAGTGQVTLLGGATSAAVVYAPNSTLKFGGNGDWYGAVITNELTDMGGASIHYDRRLKLELLIPGQYVLNSFSWSKN
jgi:Tfp pilus assembly protein PilX